MNKDDHKTGVIDFDTTRDSAAAEVVSARDFATWMIIIIRDGIFIGLGKAKGYDDDIDGDRLDVNREIEAAS